MVCWCYKDIIENEYNLKYEQKNCIVRRSNLDMGTFELRTFQVTFGTIPNMYDILCSY